MTWNRFLPQPADEEGYGAAFDELLSQSSLGSTNAQAIQATTSPEVVDQLQDELGRET